jgi:hypothetical protein
MNTDEIQKSVQICVYLCPIIFTLVTPLCSASKI